MSAFVHVLNPSRRYAKRVREFMGRFPHERAIWVERKSHPTHLETILQWAAVEGKTGIAVWAGDGTLSRAVHELQRLDVLSKTRIALVPVGTCNDFARKLALPDWRAWAEKIMSESVQEKAFDLGKVECGGAARIFVNNSGFGRMRESLGRHRSNPLKDIFGFTPKNLRLDWNLNGVHHFETRAALFGIVFNAPYFNRGMYFDADVSPEDGVLSGFFVSPQSRPRLLARFVKSRFGKSLNDAQTFRVDGSEIGVECDCEVFPQADGEAIETKEPARALRYSVLPGALKLAVPR